MRVVVEPKAGRANANTIPAGGVEIGAAIGVNRARFLEIPADEGVQAVEGWMFGLPGG